LSIVKKKTKNEFGGDLDDDPGTSTASIVRITTTSSPAAQNQRRKNETELGKNEVVILVDSSPDEKQRMLDYDDDADKNLMINDNLSLASVAQHGETDDIIESFQSGTFDNIVNTSPLDPEVTDEFVLFSNDVGSYVNDSDEENETMPMDVEISEVTDDDGDVKSKKEPSHFMTMGSENILSGGDIGVVGSLEHHTATTTEDFEAMIDSDSSLSNKDEKDTTKDCQKKSVGSSVLKKDLEKSSKLTKKDTAASSSGVIKLIDNKEQKIISTAIVTTLPIMRNILTTATTTMATASTGEIMTSAASHTQRKLPKDMTQTAKVIL
jgi:hypothetical protein